MSEGTYRIMQPVYVQCDCCKSATPTGEYSPVLVDAAPYFAGAVVQRVPLEFNHVKAAILAAGHFNAVVMKGSKVVWPGAARPAQGGDA